jgi:hypothetical protein
MVDNVCLNAVRGISDLVMVPGLINVDFADVRTIMTGMGRALMGSGRGVGDKRAIEAAQLAINSPLLEDVSINGATGILVNITGGPDLTLAEVNEACSLVQEAADPDCNIIFGSVIDANMGDEVRITVIATGFQTRDAVVAQPPVSAPRPVRRTSDHQMALPMQPPAPVSYGTMPTASARQPQAESDYGEMVVEPYPLQPYPPVAAVAYPPPVAPMPLAPSAQLNASNHPSYAAQAEQWAAPPEGRPIIRPPVTSATNAGSQSMAGNSRRTPIIPAMAAEELGIEESEYDKPAYLRRGLHAHDPSNSR